MDRRAWSIAESARHLVAAAALACVGALVSVAPAGASVVIGQVAPTAPSPTCSGTADYLQPSVTAGGNLYVAREAGTITSWSTRALTAGPSYELKIFRRMTDPDVFQVITHAAPQTLSSGLNTFPASLPVRSGDMVGLNVSGAVNSCTFSMTGDSVLTSAGSLSDGAEGTFTARNDVRLNLSAVLVPSSDFTVVVSRANNGTATVTVYASNPGTVAVKGKGLKSGRPVKPVAVAGPVSIHVRAIGRMRLHLIRTRKVTIRATATFTPTDGDPATQPFTLRLKAGARTIM